MEDEKRKAMQVSKTASEKVASTVATFLNESIIRSSESVFKRRIGYSYQADG